MMRALLDCVAHYIFMYTPCLKKGPRLAIVTFKMINGF